MDRDTQAAPKTHFTEHLPEGTELLLGQYKITKYLNSGGFGITYLAQDSLERTVVVKECFPGAFCRRSELLVQARSHAHVAELEAVVGLFLREARALSKLEHPNIVGVHQVFEFNNTAYMALDFVKGRNLLELVDSPGRSLTPRQVRSILEKLLSAVGSVHEAGLLHRDISPDNIIVTADHDPVLIDFGAAREQATKATQALSALRVVKDGYSPQEFYLAGSVQGAFSDLYSLAATFYHVITGEVPPDSQRRLSSHVAGEPDPYVPLRERTSAYDVPFCDALDRAMAILPKDRVQSAEEWRRLMNEAPKAKKRTSRISRSVPVAVSRPRPDPSRPVKPAAPAKRGDRPARRKAPLLVGSAAVAIVAAGVLLAPQQGQVADIAAVADVTSAVRAPTRPALPAPQALAAGAEEAVAPDPAAAAPASLPEERALALPLVPVPAPDAAADDVLTDLPSDLADGIVTLTWSVAPPFSVDAEGMIEGAAPGLVGGLEPGWRVAAIGTEAFDASTDLADALRAAAVSEDGRSATVSVTGVDPASEAVVIERVASGLVYTTTLAEGLTVETTPEADGWSSRVVAVPSGAALRPGDEIVAVIPTKARFESGDALARTAASAIADGMTELKVAVRRDGSMWSAALPLAPAAN